MQKSDQIFIAGHKGMIGSAIYRQLTQMGYTNLLTASHAELDLTNQQAVEKFFHTQNVNHLIIAAAKVGGIHANNEYPAEFIRENLMIQSNLIYEAWRNSVDRVLFLGSSCIYPKQAPQPLREEYLLTGPLEPTNRAYALAKISGIEMCWSYNRQYGTKFVGAMPTNLYGPGDNYDLETSHVIPALLRKFHTAKTTKQKQVVVWGTGKPRREFLHSEDAADACIHILNLPDDRFSTLLGSDETKTGEFIPPLVNVGCGRDVSISELAAVVGKITGFTGKIVFDTSKQDGTPQKKLDTSRLSELGWEFKTGLEAGLADVYKRDLSRINTANS